MLDSWLYVQPFCLFLDQILRKAQEPEVPTPLGIWELSKSSLIEEKNTNMKVTQSKIAIDPLWNPAGFIGSPLLSSVWPYGDPITSHLTLDYTTPTLAWNGITVMFWIRLDKGDILNKYMNIMVISRFITNFYSKNTFIFFKYNKSNFLYLYNNSPWILI